MSGGFIQVLWCVEHCIDPNTEIHGLAQNQANDPPPKDEIKTMYKIRMATQRVPYLVPG